MTQFDINESSQSHALIATTGDIVAAVVAARPVSPSDVPGLISEVYNALKGASEGKLAEPEPVPAVNPKKSVTPDYLICLEDGAQVQLLRRHIKTRYNMTPDEYRERWGLPANYPMVAENYSKRRSDIARSVGLGRSGNPRAGQGAKSSKR